MKGALMLAGSTSGVGKTTLASALCAALRQRGLTVQPFKVGPDYIDPGYLTEAAGRRCRNLDTWMMPAQRVRELFHHAAHDSDFAILEGVMGVFDGLGYDGPEGSSAEVAKLLDVPVVLVIDASKAARSVAALALGYQQFDPALRLAGFVLNRLGSDGHGQGVSRAVQDTTGLPVLGWLRSDETLNIPDRHLGLVPTEESGFGAKFHEHSAALFANAVDMDQLVTLAERKSPEKAPNKEPPVFAYVAPAESEPERPVIAVAQDEAFNFTYPENLDLLEAAGAQVAFFSPLRDRTLPTRTGAVMISGGFPEVHTERLAANDPMREALRTLPKRGVPIYAECGGLMYLTEAIVDSEGREHAMVGLLPGRSRMSARLKLGYRVATAARKSWLMPKGLCVRGHEFHYSEWEERPADLPSAFMVQSRRQPECVYEEGVCVDTIWASYVHLHFWSEPRLAVRFVEAARKGSTPTERTPEVLR